MKHLEQTIFKKGSTTYYWSSKFFAPSLRQDIFKLYSYVRTLDNFVDELPFQPEKLAAAEAMRLSAGKIIASVLTKNEAQVVQNILQLTKKYDFEEGWLQAFHQSMQWDTSKKQYKTLDDTMEYIYGSAEVIGLMMSRILGLPRQADPAAQLQGRAMQFINFLRDVAEDDQLGRCYFPAQDLERFGLKNLSFATARLHPKKFKEFMWFELRRYNQWQTEADVGLKHIPRRSRIAIQTAVSGYNWTAKQINEDPFKVFSRKIKPTRHQLLGWAVQHSLRASTKR